MMLTLCRKVGQVIVLELEDGETIEVVVKEIRRKQVRLGLAARQSIRIVREELYGRSEASSSRGGG